MFKTLQIENCEPIVVREVTTTRDSFRKVTLDTFE